MNMQNVYAEVELSTELFEKQTSKENRKKNSQYFTPFIIGQYMTNIIEHKFHNNTIRVLEPSGGTGKLITAFLLEIMKNRLDKIIVDIFEIDEKLIPILTKNLNMIKEKYLEKGKEIEINIICKNFLTQDSEKIYDIIIANPPYKKIKKDALDAIRNAELVFGQPNIYALFIGKGVKLLCDNGQLVYLVPRSFFNGKYFTRLRELLYNNFSVSYIHSFGSRTKVINNEILQEIVIIKIEKKVINKININHSQGIEDIKMSSKFIIDKSILWDENNKKIRLPINKDDLMLIEKMSKKKYMLKDLGWQFKTGPVVDFRLREHICDYKESEDSLPLIWCANFNKTRIQWPILNTKFPQYINKGVAKSVLLDEGNYLLIKRFSSKEEQRCLKINIIENKEFNNDKFGLENHVNYLEFDDDNIRYMKGMFILLNSGFYNRYFSIINGTTQINATDLNELPVLNKAELEEISKVPYNYEELDSKKCNDIISQYF